MLSLIKKRLSYRFQIHNLLRYSIALIYFWFGMLKFFPEVSPAEEIAKSTVSSLFYGMIPETICLYTLAVLELLIGMGLFSGKKINFVINITLAHMIFTFLPFLLFPNQSFGEVPMSLTLLGQYILKNLVIICALLMIKENINKKSFN